MKFPVPPDDAEQPEPDVLAPEPSNIPAPATKKLAEPTPEFIRDLCVAIRSGAKPMTAAMWLGVSSRREWRKWQQREGPAYDTLRREVARARMHVEVRLQSELARRSPGAALRELKKRSEHAIERADPARQYSRSGLHSMKRELPAVLARVSDDTLPLDDLSPLEQAARTWRETIIAECGGPDITLAKRSLVHAALGSWLLLSTTDAYLMDLAATGGVIDRKHRRLYAIAEQRMTIAATLSKQLQTLGLERAQRQPVSIQEAIERARGEPAR